MKFKSLILSFCLLFSATWCFEQVCAQNEQRRKVNILFEEAVSAFKAKQYQRAIYLAEEIRSIELPGETKYLAQAKQIIDSATIKQTEEYIPFLKIAAEKINKGDYIGARSLCAAMRRRDPDYPRIQQCLDVAESGQGKLDLNAPLARPKSKTASIDKQFGVKQKNKARVIVNTKPKQARYKKRVLGNKKLPVVDIEFISDSRGRTAKSRRTKVPRIKVPQKSIASIRNQGSAVSVEVQGEAYRKGDMEKAQKLYQKAIASFFREEYKESINFSRLLIEITEGTESEYKAQADRLIDKSRSLQRKRLQGILIQAEEAFAAKNFSQAKKLCLQILDRDPEFSDAKVVLKKIEEFMNR